MLFLQSTHQSVFAQIFVTNRAWPAAVPIVLHHTNSTRYFVALGMFESSEAGPQSYVKQNLMALSSSTKKVKCIISELKIVCVFNVYKPGLCSILLTNCDFTKGKLCRVLRSVDCREWTLVISGVRNHDFCSYFKGLPKLEILSACTSPAFLSNNILQNILKNVDSQTVLVTFYLHCMDNIH